MSIMYTASLPYLTEMSPLPNERLVQGNASHSEKNPFRVNASSANYGYADIFIVGRKYSTSDVT